MQSGRKLQHSHGSCQLLGMMGPGISASLDLGWCIPGGYFQFVGATDRSTPPPRPPHSQQHLHACKCHGTGAAREHLWDQTLQLQSLRGAPCLAHRLLRLSLLSCCLLIDSRLALILYLRVIPLFIHAEAQPACLHLWSPKHSQQTLISLRATSRAVIPQQISISCVKDNPKCSSHRLKQTDNSTKPEGGGRGHQEQEAKQETRNKEAISPRREEIKTKGL